VNKHRLLWTTYALMWVVWLVLVVLFPETPKRPEAVYQGRTTSEWSKEISRGDTLYFPVGGYVKWQRHPDWRDEWAKKLSLKPQPSEIPLLNGDPAAVPVLIELLESSDSSARLIAMGGLRRAGPAAEAALPVLRRLQADSSAEHDYWFEAEERVADSAIKQIEYDIWVKNRAN
jgi:hypothetical protein